MEFKGRFDFKKEKTTFAWSASQINIHFYGTGLDIILKGYGNNYFTILLDGIIIENGFHVKDMKHYTKANLTLGNHTLTLFKNTEYNIGFVEMLDVVVQDGELISKVDSKERKIMFIGDSITCGFGVLTNQVDLEYDSKYDNAYLSYASICARVLDADFHIIACSGYGLIRNYGGDRKNTMPTMIDKITPISKKSWDKLEFIPQVVVINLGTNDFSENYIPNKHAFVEAYQELIKRLKDDYPDVKILCTVGPVLSDPALSLSKEYVETVVSSFSDVYYLAYTPQKREDGYGLSYHPSKITHEKMAKELMHKLREIMRWNN